MYRKHMSHPRGVAKPESKYRKFALFLFQGIPPREAYQSAGLIGNDNAMQMAIKRTKPIIRELELERSKAIAQREATITQEVVKRTGINKARIIEELATIAFAPVWSQEDAKKKDGVLRVRVADKRAALVDIAKLQGYWVDRHDFRVIKDVADLSTEELDALIKSQTIDVTPSRNG